MESLFFCTKCNCQRDSLICLLCGEADYIKTQEEEK